jgi:hypothetical protein
VVALCLTILPIVIGMAFLTIKTNAQLSQASQNTVVALRQAEGILSLIPMAMGFPIVRMIAHDKQAHSTIRVALHLIEMVMACLIIKTNAPIFSARLIIQDAHWIEMVMVYLIIRINVLMSMATLTVVVALYQILTRMVCLIIRMNAQEYRATRIIMVAHYPTWTGMACLIPATNALMSMATRTTMVVHYEEIKRIKNPSEFQRDFCV